MPNWCSNSATLKPPTVEQGKELIEVLKSGEQCVFNHLYPIPEALRETNAPNTNEEQAKQLVETYGYADWYSFCVEEWGTKWEPDVHTWEICGDEIYLGFDTAWAPPIALYDKLVEAGWGVAATYCEEGMAFVGDYKDGVEDYYEYGGMSADEIENYLPQHLDEEYCLSENARQWEEDNEEDDESLP